MKRFALALALLAVSGLLEAGSQVTAKKAALATASPYATQVGIDVMRRGGNALDAAIAVSFALAVVHPQAGNLGGGGFLLYYDAKSGAVWSLDFREVAPLAATKTMFVGPDGKPKELASRTGALAAGVPGSVAGMEEAHRKFGSRPWKELLAPAISLARDGFRTDARLERDLAAEQKTRKIDRFASTASVFYPGGKPVAAGTLLLQPDLAATLQRIADKGAADFYEGATAKKIVQAMGAGGGIIGYRDLREYKPVWRAPLRIDFRGSRIYTMPPPSGGGLVMAEMLSILDGYDLATLGMNTAPTIHLMAEASRRAFYDRNKYIADPASSHIPFRELLSEERSKQWRSTIALDHATPAAEISEPGAFEGSNTTHYSIVDAEGNIAAVTTTINDNFGSGLVVDGAGFLLNDEMDDFTTAPGQPNAYGLVQSAANSIEPGKRPASSMSPTIVMRQDKPWLVLGTRGGSTIPTSILQVMLDVMVFGKPLAASVAAPRFHHQGNPDSIFYEKDQASPELLQALNAMGHGVQAREPIGEIYALQIEAGGITAVADPRASGAAGGY